MGQWFDIVFETFINCLQAFIFVWYLTRCLGCKEKYSKFKSVLIGSAAFVVLLETQTFLTDFEGIFSVLILVLLLLYSIVFLSGSYAKKILCSVIVFSICVVTTSVLGIVMGTIVGENYVEFVTSHEIIRYLTVSLNQILLILSYEIVSRLIAKNDSIGNGRYTILISSLLIFGMLAIVLLLILSNADSETDGLVYVCLIVICLIAMVLISLIMYRVAEKEHIRRLERELEYNSIIQQQKDVDEIISNVQAIQEVRHELNKVIGTMAGLIEEKKYDEVVSFVNQFKREEIDRIQKINYTENSILNYILNAKIKECKKNDIAVKYYVNGEITGIKEVDLHCIVNNLLDNAIEATQSLEHRYVELVISANEHSIYIEVSNTADSGVEVAETTIKTTKADKFNHGYGIGNVKRCVEKYNGTINYEIVNNSIVKCQIILLKQL